MKNLATIKKEIGDLFDSKYKEIDIIPDVDNIGYKTYGKNWATVVSIDIVGFKEMVEKNENEHITKILQSFTSLLTEKAEEYDNFKDVYFAGDEVLVVFSSPTKKYTTQAVEYSFYANVLANNVIADVAKEKFGIELKAGVGVWTSSDNSFVLIGKKSSKHVTSTLVGDAINKASVLSKKAGRIKGYTQYPSILMNNMSYANCVGQTKDSLDKWSKRFGTESNQKIWGNNIVKSKFMK